MIPSEVESTPVRVLLVDDHTVVRKGLRRILDAADGIETVGEAGDGRAAVALAQELKPDVVVMDITLPELNGIDATRQIRSRAGDCRVVVLSMHTDDVYIRQAVRGGASGYLLKDSEEVDLVTAIKAVARGESVFSPAAAKVLQQSVAARGQEIEDSLGLLTAREREVLQLIAEGKTNREIAARLSLSINTIETHRKHIMEKLDLHNTAELVRFAVRKRLVA